MAEKVEPVGSVGMAAPVGYVQLIDEEAQVHMAQPVHLAVPVAQPMMVQPVAQPMVQPVAQPMVQPVAQPAASAPTCQQFCVMLGSALDAAHSHLVRLWMWLEEAIMARFPECAAAVKPHLDKADPSRKWCAGLLGILILFLTWTVFSLLLFGGHKEPSDIRADEALTPAPIATPAPRPAPTPAPTPAPVRQQDVHVHVHMPAQTPQQPTPQPPTPQPRTPQPPTPQPRTPQPRTPQPWTPQPRTPQRPTPQYQHDPYAHLSYHERIIMDHH